MDRGRPMHSMQRLWKDARKKICFPYSSPVWVVLYARYGLGVTGSCKVPVIYRRGEQLSGDNRLGVQLLDSGVGGFLALVSTCLSNLNTQRQLGPKA